MKIFFKAEANSKIGGGHLHRCISIAKEFISRGFEISFIFSDSSESSIEKIKNLNWETHLIPKEGELNFSVYEEFIPKGSFILFDTDNPKFYSGDLIDYLRKNQIKTACYTITDAFPITTDILINTNVVSETHTYNTPSYTRQIIGAKYLIFSKKFQETIQFETQEHLGTNLFIFMGNADPLRLTEKVLSQLSTIEVIGANQIHVLVGHLKTNFEEIEKISKGFNLPITIHRNVSNMVKLYEEMDLAITAAGMTMWEMALYKIPQIVIPSSERENSYASFLEKKGFIHLINHNEINLLENKLIEVSSTARKLKLQDFKDLLNPNGVKIMVSELIDYTN